MRCRPNPTRQELQLVIFDLTDMVRLTNLAMQALYTELSAAADLDYSAKHVNEATQTLRSTLNFAIETTLSMAEKASDISEKMEKVA